MLGPLVVECWSAWRRDLWCASILISLPLLGCQNEYPLPPTACDDWCDATKNLECDESYSPSGCVRDCEQQRLGSIPACSEDFKAALRCFQEAAANDTSRRCRLAGGDYFGEITPPECASARQQLFTCIELKGTE